MIKPDKKPNIDFVIIKRENDDIICNQKTQLPLQANPLSNFQPISQPLRKPRPRTQTQTQTQIKPNSRLEQPQQ